MRVQDHDLLRVSRNLFLCDPHSGQQEKRASQSHRASVPEIRNFLRY